MERDRRIRAVNERIQRVLDLLRYRRELRDDLRELERDLCALQRVCVVIDCLDVYDRAQLKLCVPVRVKLADHPLHDLLLVREDDVEHRVAAVESARETLRSGLDVPVAIDHFDQTVVAVKRVVLLQHVVKDLLVSRTEVVDVVVRRARHGYLAIRAVRRDIVLVLLENLVGRHGTVDVGRADARVPDFPGLSH